LSPRALWTQLKAEHFGFWCACAYLFFEYVRPQSIYPWVDILPWASMFAVLALLASFAEVRAPINRGVVLSKLLVLYGAIVLLSSAFGYDPALSLSRIGDYFNWLFIYFAIIRTVTSRTRFFLFFTLYMLCNLKMTQHGFITWAQRGFGFAGWGVSGAPGWFQNSGEFGIQLCIFTPLIVAFVLALRPYCKPAARWALYFLPITAVGSTIASSSRGALVGLGAAGLWAFIASKHFFKTAICVAAIAIAVYALIPEESRARFSSSGTDRTSLVRMDRWEKAWQTMKEHPVLGIGHKNWEPYYHDHLNYGIRGTVMVHNMFLESGTEHGFLGLGALLLIFVSMFVVNARTRRLATSQNDKFSVYVAHGFDAGNLGLIISGSFVTVLYYPFVWIQAAMVAALYLSVQAPSHTPQVATKKAALSQEASAHSI
jgi:putative inorganic carbon (HCO3(-)) transporter